MGPSFSTPTLQVEVVRQQCVPHLQQIAANLIESFWNGDVDIKGVNVRNVSSLLHMASATWHYRANQVILFISNMFFITNDEAIIVDVTSPSHFLLLMQ